VIFIGHICALSSQVYRIFPTQANVLTALCGGSPRRNCLLRGGMRNAWYAAPGLLCTTSVRIA
jgi:hypothetical protein